MSLDTSVRNLAQLSRQLNEYTDRMNAKIRQMEAELRDAGLGSYFWLDDDIHADGEDFPEVFRLGWSKHGRNWGFHCRVESPAEGERSEIVPLLDAPRSIRLAAFPKVATLVAKITDSAARAVADFEAIAAELPDKAPPAEDAAPTSDDDIPF